MRTRPLTPRQMDALYSALCAYEAELEDDEQRAEDEHDKRGLRRVHAAQRVLESIHPTLLRRVT